MRPSYLRCLCTFVCSAAFLGAFIDPVHAGTECGDAVCDPGEDFCNCSDDCDDPNPSACDPCECGSFSLDCFCDLECISSGDCCANSCDACGFCPDVCGNFVCESGEDSCNCPLDCERTTCSPCDCGVFEGFGCFCDSACLTFNDCCDNACEVCDVCAPVCDNGTCELGENCESCPADCGCAECDVCDGGSCVFVCDVFCDEACCGPCGGCETECGDGECIPKCGENCDTCPGDCGACPGACCVTDAVAGNGSSCILATASACSSLGGEFHGEGTSCDSNPCEPSGACCLPAGGGKSPNCIIFSESSCQDANGTYQGDGSTCDACIGACCGGDLDLAVAGSPGCEETGRSQCENAGGEFRGFGTSCANESCLGACCGGSGPGGNVAGPAPGCAVVTASQCADIGGLYQGDGTDCAACLGACCVTGGNVAGLTACLTTTRDACDNLSGIFHGEGSVCGPGVCDSIGACCVSNHVSAVAGTEDGCVEVTSVTCRKGLGGEFLGVGTSCESGVCNPDRVDITTKGSLLIFSDVELEWTESAVAGGGGFNLTKDTVISLTNDYPGEVFVQMYFINGDPERDAIFSPGPAPILISEAEPGCNWVDCQVLLTPDQPVYWSAATGNPLGCQPFGILDPDLGNGPGRPNPDGPGRPRVLRGYIIAWAVDAHGTEINWNHLSGKATIVDYAAQAAWEYNAWAFQALFGVHGEQLPNGSGAALSLDGFEYDSAFDMLLFDFFAAGSGALSSGANAVSVDTDLTLHPVTVDLRQEHRPPVTTKAHFDIWNMNERKLSNTRRCITCWDQVLLSQFDSPNSFLLINLQSDKGKARIDGKQADECEENCFREEDPKFSPDSQTAGFLDDLLDLEFVCSNDAAILGVAAKILRFGNNTIDYAGSELVGMGVQSAIILYDIIDPPGSLRDDAFERIRGPVTKTERRELGRDGPSK